MKFKHNLSKFTAVCLSAIIAVPCSTVYAAEEPILSKYKSFSDVFSESIDTKISDISYGIIRYPAIGADYAAELEKDDLTKLMNAYNNTKGICILAPMKDFDILNSADPEYPYFYIGVSSALPAESYKWYSSGIKMSQLCFGGSYGGAVVYGGYGIVESTYGKDYPPALPINFVWYKPIDTNDNDITKIANEIYNKYKSKAKPLGDFDDNNFFNGCDLTFDTLLHLPQCFIGKGCSDWAYSYLHYAAQQNLIPYNTSKEYTSPLTRRECCELIANMLNVTSGSYTDLFKYPNSYAALSEKAKKLDTNTKDVEYTDISENDESIKLLSSVGIINGTDAKTFNPNGYITREQLCTILGRIFKLYPEFYNYVSDSLNNTITLYSDDLSISPWAYDYVYSMSKLGFVNGADDNMFLPQEFCTLEQVLTIVERTSAALPSYPSKL